MFFKNKKGMDFVDVGDPSAVHFNKDDLILDGEYHELDLSGIIPKAARLVMIMVRLEGSAGYPDFKIRRKGNVNTIADDIIRVITVNTPYFETLTVACGSDGIIEYRGKVATYTTCNLIIRGWFEV